MQQLAPALAPPPARSSPVRRPPPASTGLHAVLVDQPEPQVEALRGVRLVLVWLGMLAASWLVAVALGYGLFALLRALAA